jgi:hypothetical protein
MANARYLLDTNIVSDLVRNPQGRVAERIRVVGEENVCTSLIVSSELRFGALKKSFGSSVLPARNGTFGIGCPAAGSSGRCALCGLASGLGIRGYTHWRQ